MSKEKIHEKQSSEEPNVSDVEQLNNFYLSSSKYAYRPSMENIEGANNLNPSKSELKASDTEKFKRLYLPNSKANYQPSMESIEDVNDLN